MTEDDLHLIRRAVEGTKRMPNADAQRVLAEVFELRDEGKLTAETLDRLLADF